MSPVFLKEIHPHALTYKPSILNIFIVYLIFSFCFKFSKLQAMIIMDLWLLMNEFFAFYLHNIEYSLAI